MNRTFLLFISIFSLFLSACVSHSDQQQFSKQQAAKARVELALGYLAERDFVQAKRNLDKALNHTPDYYLVHSAFAYFYQQQGQVEKAQSAYLQALKLDKQQGDVFNNYGAFLCSQGQFAQAYAQFEQALNTKNYYRHADTYENMALCASSEKNTAVYQSAVELLRNIDAQRASLFAEKLNPIKK